MARGNGELMRTGLVIIGLLLLILGIAFEALYVTNSQITFSGTTVTLNTWLATGIVFIFGGLLLSLAGIRIPKVQTTR
jgi:hypothetical protein